MKRKLSSKQSGFTLVEIMIVVAIIALLATIAVPNFLRARERSQATSIVEEMRVVEAAMDTYAIEQNKGKGEDVTFTQIKPYLKPGSRLEQSSGTDIMGGAITVSKIGTQPKLIEATVKKFSTDVVPATFWGPYYP